MKNEEKLCLFFTSDYHFEMISLPYINEKLKENKKVIVMTENNLSNTITKVLDNVNLKSEEKEKIERINWENNNFDKIEEVDDESIIFVKGKKEYINNVNKNLNDNKNIQIIDCYDINEVGNSVKEIAKEYSKVLSTSGIEKLL